MAVHAVCTLELATEVSAIAIGLGSGGALAEAIYRRAGHEELRQHLGRQANAHAVHRFALERKVGSTVDPERVAGD